MVSAGEGPLLGAGQRPPSPDPGEAGLLQGFPASYPWTGSRTSQFRQVGDVVSPVVAAALIGAVTRVDWEPVLRDYLAGLYRRSPDSKAG